MNEEEFLELIQEIYDGKVPLRNKKDRRMVTQQLEAYFKGKLDKRNIDAFNLLYKRHPTRLRLLSLGRRAVLQTSRWMVVLDK